MPPRQDLTGRQFEFLEVLEPNDEHVVGQPLKWWCRCSCGELTLAVGQNLRSGNTKSCGCLKSTWRGTSSTSSTTTTTTTLPFDILTNKEALGLFRRTIETHIKDYVCFDGSNWRLHPKWAFEMAFDWIHNGAILAYGDLELSFHDALILYGIREENIPLIVEAIKAAASAEQGELPNIANEILGELDYHEHLEPEIQVPNVRRAIQWDEF